MSDKVIKKKDLNIRQGIYREFDSPYTISKKLYKSTIVHIPTQIEASYISEISLSDSYNTALENLTNKMCDLLNISPQSMQHLSEEGQKEYNETVEKLFKDTDIPLFY